MLMDEIFKGYVRTSQKRCTQKFKNMGSDDLLSYEQASKLSEFAGIIADGYIIIDVDNTTQADVLMDIVEDLQLNCRVYKTTRGRHFCFRNTQINNCGTHKRLACGLEADIKVGGKNSYSILKYNDKERLIEFDKDPDSPYDELPKWLYPVNSKIDFSNLDEGDGRNQNLFNYILTLQSEDFTKEECKETIRLINKYVLPEELDDEELEKILRDDSFNAPVFYVKGVFQLEKFCNYLIHNEHVIKLNNKLHIYSDGIYVEDEEEIERRIVKLLPGCRRQQRKEVIDYLRIMIKSEYMMSDARYIVFKNGLYNIETDTLSDFTPDIVVKNKINHNYNPSAYHELLDTTLNKMSNQDPQIRALLEEMAGYCFYRRNELRKAFILIGDKANGKSTFLDLIVTMIGEDNSSALDISDLKGFRVAQLYGMLINAGDDIGDDFVSGNIAALVKKLISGERVTVEQKGKDPYKFINYSKFIWSSNSIPRIKDKTGALLDRLIIVPFLHTFSKDDPDYRPYIKYELRQEDSIEYLIKLSVEGLKRVLINRAFTTSDKVNDEWEKYREDNNPVIQFINEVGETEIINEPTKNVFAKYKEFCIVNNYTQLSHVQFSKALRGELGVETVNQRIDGKVVKVFSAVTSCS